MRKKIDAIKSNLVKGFLCLGLPLFIWSCTDDNSYTHGTWTAASEFDGAGRSDAAYFQIGSTGYVFGGWKGKSGIDYYINDLWKFDMSSTSRGAWEELSPSNSSNIAGRLGAVGFALNVNGKDYGYITTGYKGYASGGTEEYFLDTWRYDAANNTWEQMADFEGEARHNAIAFSLNGKAYVGTGENVDSDPLKDFWEYDPIADTWTKLAGEMAYPGRKRTGAVAFVINNEAYVVTGYGDGVYRDDFYKFNPNASTPWTELEYISNRTDSKFDDDYGTIPRAYAVSFVIDDLAYLVTGTSGSLKTDYWVYYPETDRWNNDDFTPITSSKESISGRVGAVAFSWGEYGYFGLGGPGTGAASRYSDFVKLDPLLKYED